MPRQPKEKITVTKKPYGGRPKTRLTAVKEDLVEAIRRPNPTLERQDLDGTPKEIIDAFKNNIEMVEQAARKAYLEIYLSLGEAMSQSNQQYQFHIRLPDLQWRAAERIYQVLDHDTIRYSRSMTASCFQHIPNYKVQELKEVIKLAKLLKD